jgi:hypothetical protein
MHFRAGTAADVNGGSRLELDAQWAGIIAHMMFDFVTKI